MIKAASSLFEQVALSEMEFGLAQPIAVTRAEPAALAEKTGVTFEPARDDLDELVAALLRGASGRQFALVRHLHQPTPGTTILTNEGSCDFARDLKEALATLRITAADLIWMHPAVADAFATSAI